MQATLSLPYPPSTNRLYANNKAEGRIKTREYKSWLNTALWQLKTQSFRQIEGDFSTHIKVGRPNRRYGDLDNKIKPIMDALVKAGAVKDDRYAIRHVIEWLPGSNPLSVTVTLREE